MRLRWCVVFVELDGAVRVTHWRFVLSVLILVSKYISTSPWDERAFSLCTILAIRGDLGELE